MSLYRSDLKSKRKKISPKNRFLLSRIAAVLLLVYTVYVLLPMPLAVLQANGRSHQSLYISFSIFLGVYIAMFVTIEADKILPETFQEYLVRHYPIIEQVVIAVTFLFTLYKLINPNPNVFQLQKNHLLTIVMLGWLLFVVVGYLKKREHQVWEKKITDLLERNDKSNMLLRKKAARIFMKQTNSQSNSYTRPYPNVTKKIPRKYL